ncbi:hypothetical protein F5Y03DRAFT_87157 [Xylaria venustula]|nr:hypothetical protein F5Y03DRAFT_87157 [Xylaria venustula]
MLYVVFLFLYLFYLLTSSVANATLVRYYRLIPYPDLILDPGPFPYIKSRNAGRRLWSWGRGRIYNTTRIFIQKTCYLSPKRDAKTSLYHNHFSPPFFFIPTQRRYAGYSSRSLDCWRGRFRHCSYGICWHRPRDRNNHEY